MLLPHSYQVFFSSSSSSLQLGKISKNLEHSAANTNSDFRFYQLWEQIESQIGGWAVSGSSLLVASVVLKKKRVKTHWLRQGGGRNTEQIKAVFYSLGEKRNVGYWKSNIGTHAS